jgi:hypothetical protein
MKTINKIMYTQTHIAKKKRERMRGTQMKKNQ